MVRSQLAWSDNPGNSVEAESGANKKHAPPAIEPLAMRRVRCRGTTPGASHDPTEFTGASPRPRFSTRETPDHPPDGRRRAQLGDEGKVGPRLPNARAKFRARLGSTTLSSCLLRGLPLGAIRRASLKHRHHDR